MTAHPQQVACVVPARAGSSRFPNKPLALIAGVPMILRTLMRAQQAGCFGRIICATDSSEIAQVAQEGGFEAVLTPADMRTGSDRVAWVAQQHQLPLVVNLQGDEPIASLPLLQQIARALIEQPDVWWTGASVLEPHQKTDRNSVKVLVDATGSAVDFIREIPPHNRREGEWFRHVGFYGYSQKQLHLFAQSPTSAVERERSLEQLRLFPTTPIKVVVVEQQTAAVDCPSDIALVERYIYSRGTLGHER